MQMINMNFCHYNLVYSIDYGAIMSNVVSFIQ